MHGSEGELWAAVDVGTNTVLLLVARPERGGGLEVHEETCRTPRLGEGLAQRGRLGGEASLRALGVLREYAGRLRQLGVPPGRTRVVATAALRRAQDAREFVQRVQAECGLVLEVIGEEEEAALAHLAVAGEPGAAPAAVLDVGGGSTEYTRADGSLRRSAPVGAVVLSERFGADAAGFAGLLEAARAACAVFPESDASGEALVLLGGSAVNLAAREGGFERFDPRRAEGRAIDAASAGRWAADLAALPLEQRLRLPIERERASILPAGLACAAAALERVRPASVRVSGRGLRYGVLRDLIARADGPAAG